MRFLAGIRTSISETKYILFLFLSTRLVLTLIGVLSRTILGHTKFPYKGSKHLWLSIWGVFDTAWYVDIAANGYTYSDTIPLYNQQENWAFFPLYPMLVKILGTVIGDRYYIAGVIISNVCLITACFLLFNLARLNLNKETALNSIKYLFLFPTAFILSGVFTESLYLLLVLSCFYFAKKQSWLFAGVSGFFLSLTRPLGALIVIPLVYEYFKSKKIKPKFRLELIFILFIPLEISLFGSYNYYLTGDFFAFKNIQSAPGWERSITNPISVLISGFHLGISSHIRYLVEASFATISLIALIIFYRKIHFSYWLFGMYSILIPLLTGLSSMPRLILPIFPFYILLAKFSKNYQLDQIATVLMGLNQGFLMVFWSYGYTLIV